MHRQTYSALHRHIHPRYSSSQSNLQELQKEPFQKETHSSRTYVPTRPFPLIPWRTGDHGMMDHKRSSSGIITSLHTLVESKDTRKMARDRVNEDGIDFEESLYRCTDLKPSAILIASIAAILEPLIHLPDGCQTAYYKGDLREVFVESNLERIWKTRKKDYSRQFGSACGMVNIQEEVVGSVSFLEIEWLDGHQTGKIIRSQRLNTQLQMAMNS
ncbi:hypothetical protein Tco_0414650 [Tanacetum coccineum]